jgi:hypothetical protein
MKAQPTRSKGSPTRKVYNHEAYIKKSERTQINDLMLYLKLVEKQEQANQIPKQAEVEQ